MTKAAPAPLLTDGPCKSLQLISASQRVEKRQNVPRRATAIAAILTCRGAGPAASPATLMPTPAQKATTITTQKDSPNISLDPDIADDSLHAAIAGPVYTSPSSARCRYSCHCRQRPSPHFVSHGTYKYGGYCGFTRLHASATHRHRPADVHLTTGTYWRHPVCPTSTLPSPSLLASLKAPRTRMVNLLESCDFP